MSFASVRFVMRFLWLLCIFFLWGTSLHAQRRMMIEHEGQPHDILAVEGKNFIFLNDGKRTDAPIATARSAFTYADAYLPGHVWVKDLKGQVRPSGIAYLIDFVILARASRDLTDAYLVIEWFRSETERFRIVCKVGELKKGKVRRLAYSLPVDEEYVDTRYSLHFMSGGYEIPVTEVDFEPQTPFQRFIEAGGAVVDGPPAQLKFAMPAGIKDDDGKRIEGNVKLKVTVDKDGYVQAARPTTWTDSRLIEPCLQAIRFCDFKPQIKRGKPVRGEIVIPFVFDGGVAE